MSVLFHIRAIPKSEVVLVTAENIKYLTSAMTHYVQDAISKSLDLGYMHHGLLEVSMTMLDELKALEIGKPAPVNDATLSFLAPVLEDLFDSNDDPVYARYARGFVEKKLRIDVNTEGGNVGDIFKHTNTGTLSNAVAFHIVVNSKRIACQEALDQYPDADKYMKLFSTMIEMSKTHWLSLSWG